MSDTIDGLKQRLVGAFVILTLAIIFLPMIFDKPHSVTTTEIKSVPARPDFAPIVINAPKKPVFEKIELDPDDKKIKSVQKDQVVASKPKTTKAEVVAAVDSGNSIKSSGNDSTEKAAEPTDQSTIKIEKPKVSHLPVFEKVWMVQLGTFGDSKNAYRLRDRLRNDGFDAHTKKTKVDGKTAIRVFSGPFVNKQLATKTKLKLDAKYKVKSIVLKLDP